LSADIIADAASLGQDSCRLFTMLFGRGIFLLDALPMPCVCWSGRRSLGPTVADDNLFFMDVSILANEIMHRSTSSLFTVLWMLPNSRKARFCTSNFKIYSIANTTDSQMFWLLLINLRVAPFTTHHTDMAHGEIPTTRAHCSVSSSRLCIIINMMRHISEYVIKMNPFLAV
jgi:hypothetical protein